MDILVVLIPVSLGLGTLGLLASYGPCGTGSMMIRQAMPPGF